MEHLILVNNALNVLCIACVPLIIATAFGGTVVSAVMAASGVQERSLSYAARVIIVVVVLYYLLPYVVSQIVALSELSLK